MWKTAVLLAHGKTEHSDLTLLVVNNEHIFLQQHSSICIQVSSVRMDQLGHFPPHIHIESHSNAKLLCCLLFEGVYETK